MKRLSHNLVLAAAPVFLLSCAGSLSQEWFSKLSKSLLSITISPANPSALLGETQTFTAIGHYSDGSVADLTASVTWKVTNGTGAASITSTGLVNTAGHQPGSVTVSASFNSVTANTSLSVGGYTINTVAGSYWPTYGNGGLATGIILNSPKRTATDSSGNVYIADTGNNMVRKVTVATGDATIIAGTGNAGYTGDGGLAVNATLNSPISVVVDASGNVYISDTNNFVIRKIDGSGIISTVAGTGTPGYSGDGGPATSARIRSFAGGLALDSAGNIYIADSDNYAVRKITISNGIISTVAGGNGSGVMPCLGDGGAATSAHFSYPTDVAVDSNFNIYVDDDYAYVVRKVTHATGIISTVAGTCGMSGYTGDGGLATSATLFYANGIAVDASDNFYIADSLNYAIREVTISNGNINTVAGNHTSGYTGDGGLATSAALTLPDGLSVDASGNLYIADTSNAAVRKVTAATGDISTAAGGASVYSGDGGPATSALMSAPMDVALDSAGNLYIADQKNSVVRKVSASTGHITTVAGTGTAGFSGDGGAATLAKLKSPQGVAVDSSGNIYISDTGNQVIRKVNASTGKISTIAGTASTSGFSGDGGAATSAKLNIPRGLAVDSVTGDLYIADFNNYVVRKVSASTGDISTVAGIGLSYGYSGDGGPATSAQLMGPTAVALDSSGNLFIADYFSAVIRKVDASTGKISSFAGTGVSGYSGDGGPASAAQVSSVGGVAIDSSGNVYISDYSRIRKVSAATGDISTIAGNGTSGFSGDGGLGNSARLAFARGLTVDSSGNIYIADGINNLVRKLTP